MNRCRPTRVVQLLILLQLCHVITCRRFNITEDGGQQGFTVTLDDITILKHTQTSPMIYAGRGETSFPEESGNFFIQDYTTERLGLSNYSFSCTEDGCSMLLGKADTSVALNLQEDRGQPLMIELFDQTSDIDRVWLRVMAEEGEEIYGGGEQYSYFNLRHRDVSGQNIFPIWTQEQGVGRNKSTQVTFIADVESRSGGDYYTTYFPQPTFVSSRHYFFHHDAANYAVFDFSHSDFHEVLILGKPGKIYFNTADSLMGVVTNLTSFLGRMPQLPDWIQGGAILGMQGGTQMMLSRYQYAKDNHIPVAGLWIQDWSGKYDTPFGQRVNWDWKWDPKWYPDLDKAIQNLTTEGVRVLAYINPNLYHEGELFKEAASKDFLVKNSTGGVYLGRSLTLVYGTVDMTNPQAYSWYKNVIKTNMIGLGLGGWMADFGEYLPADAVMHDGRSGQEVHNDWPVLWARLNREALEETGKLGEIVFFMRAGFTGSSNYSTMMWNGDQNVDFSLADGVRSTIYGTLSMAMSGVGLCHFDIGGYTTFSQLGLQRTQELLLRSAEMAVFTPVFRTHEGNQPQANIQWYTPSATTAFAQLARMFALLKNYRKFVVDQVSSEGIPAQRPVNLVFEGNEATPSQYMFGPDLLVAPIITESVVSHNVVLPANTEGFDWIHLWTAKSYKGGHTVLVPAPMGQPPVFYRSDSRFKADFDKLREELVADSCDPIIG